MASSSEFTGSPSTSAWLSSSLDNMTDITDSPTSAAGVRYRSNLAVYLASIKITLLTLCALGLLFNGFVLVVLIYGKQRRRLNCNIFIINQSLADFMGCLSLHRVTCYVLPVLRMTTVCGQADALSELTKGLVGESIYMRSAYRAVRRADPLVANLLVYRYPITG